MQNDNVIGSTMNKKQLLLKQQKLVKIQLLPPLLKLSRRRQGPIQRLADIISGYFVPIVVGIAIFTFIIWISLVQPGQFEPALVAAIAVLVIACPVR